MIKNSTFFKYISLAATLFISLIAEAQEQDMPSLKLWYNQPSGTIWDNALPIGNGRLGAMVYGNVAQEILQLNEHTLWSGGPNRNDNPMALDSLERMRQLIFSGQQKEAEKLANRVMVSKKSHGQIFQPLGDLKITFPNHNEYTEYYRDLDIGKAIATTRYKVGKVTYTRRYIASSPDNVIAIELTADKVGSISFSASFSSPQPNKTISILAPGRMAIAGTAMDHEGVKGQVKFKGITQIVPSGGLVTSTDTSLLVTNANSVTIYLTAATNFKSYNDLSANENERANVIIDKVLKKDFNTVLAEHVKAYQKYFNRVKLDLGPTTTEINSLPTNERLKIFKTVNDPEFAALYYQFGRYLLISSSQPGGQPANLQGIWNNRLHPSWDSKYTININTEMNYWPAEKTNLSEMHEPLLEMVKELAVTGKQTAKDMYGARGWVAHHNTDIWRTTGAVDGAFWGAWVNGGGWLSQHLWEHYLYNGDKKYLKSVYDVLKGAALFYNDFLVQHPKYKWLVLAPD
ncbi:MAG: glycoside hydrolase family 95 protein, partial [Sphingobacteriales bacterium]